MGLQRDWSQQVDQFAAGGGERDLVAAPVGRILRPRDQAAAFQVVDPGDEMALVEVERRGQLLLRLRAEVGQRGENAVMDQDEVVLGLGSSSRWRAR